MRSSQKKGRHKRDGLSFGGGEGYRRSPLQRLDILTTTNEIKRLETSRFPTITVFSALFPKIVPQMFRKQSRQHNLYL